MKPFDLEAALAGQPVVTRDGRPVKIAGYNTDAMYCSNIVGWVLNFAYVWDKTGKCLTLNNSILGDLFMAPTERKEWVVRVDFKDLETTTITGPYTAEETAESNKDGWLKAGFKATIHEITVIE